MKLKAYFGIFVLVAALLVVFSGCTGILGEEESSASNVPIYLTDSPLSDIDALWVKIDGVAYHYEYMDGEEKVEKTLTTDVSTEVDLVSLAGTEVEFVDLSGIPEDATLVWVGLDISQATVVLNGEKISVDISINSPFNFLGKAYFKIMIHEKITSDSEFIFDFDVAQSLRYIPGINKYILIPVIAHWHRHRTHAGGWYEIIGIVKDNNGNAIKHAGVFMLTSDESTILRVTLTKKDGEFALKGVKDGEYIVAIVANEDIPNNDTDLITWLKTASDTATDVTVSSNDVNLGEITINTTTP